MPKMAMGIHHCSLCFAIQNGYSGSHTGSASVYPWFVSLPILCALLILHKLPLMLKSAINVTPPAASFLNTVREYRYLCRQTGLVIHENSNETAFGVCDDDVPEWAMIEINGELLLPLEVSKDMIEASSTEPSASFSEGMIELGALSFRDEIPILIVGTHELQGVIEELSEPFVCLQAESQNNETRYTVTGVVRRKLLFNRYPKTLLR